MKHEEQQYRKLIHDLRREKKEANDRNAKASIAQISIAIAALLTACGVIGQCSKAKGHGGEKQSVVARDHFETQEINHLFDEKGNKVFDQVLFSNIDDGEMRVEAWRLMRSENQVPTGTSNAAVWMDGETMRHVTSDTVKETWTQYDPEMENRDRFCKDARKELMRMFIVDNPFK